MRALLLMLTLAGCSALAQDAPGTKPVEPPEAKAQGDQPKGDAGQAEAQPTDPTQPGEAKEGEAKEPEKPTLKAGTFGALSARCIGPALFSGRVADIAVNPRDPSEFYIAVASGGMWKTVNAGVTFSPIMDSSGSYSFGCVTIDPNDPNVVWVGSGENNSQRSVGFGDGVYVSRDAGKNFTNVGLKESEHIGRIVVDPRDSRVVYAAAHGPLWRTGGERGLYKTNDGGATWERILHIDDDTGINEVHIDPGNPDVLYASSYQRRRHVWTLINGGPGSGVHKSTDAGKTWRKIEKGLPGVDKGKIGLCVAPANPEVLYAIVEAANGEGGVYRSSDRGETWEKRSSYVSNSPQYYNELIPDPTNADRIFSMDTFMHVSDDGGKSFSRVPIADVHVDSHALWIDPRDTRHMIQGNDGGLYETFDGTNWRHVTNLPVMQFYRVAVDNAAPFYNVYGGTQDNSTLGGPSRTFDRMGIANDDWFLVVGGDGFEPAIDPEDHNIVYGQWQHAGLVRMDRRTGEIVDIKPREREGDAPFVWNWDSALIISPHNPARLYFGSRVLHRSDDRGDSWTTVSPDLTRGVDRNALPVMGVIQKPDAVAKHVSTSIYGNIVSLTESPLAEGLIYVGTDDGLVQVTEDAGKTWRKVESFPGVPAGAYVSELEACRHNASTVFACFDHHKSGDFTPYVLRSDDRGVTWHSIAGDLGPREVCYSIAQDHVNPSLLFIGTEFGAYFSLDAGGKWFKMAGVPTIAVRDVEIQRRENDVVMATFGRGFYVLDDYTPLRTIDAGMLDQEVTMFAPREALRFVPRSRVGGSAGRGWLGATHYAAKNPPMGAVFTYYLKEKITSRKERRKEAEKKEGWEYPTIDQFRAEDREEDPKVILTILDAQGKSIRRLNVPRAEGMHRVSWNLRYPDADPVSLSAGSVEPWDVEFGGTLAKPGTYTAVLSKVVDGMSADIAGPIAFEVKAVDLSPRTAKGDALHAKFAFERDLTDLQRAIGGAGRLVDEALNRINHLRAGVSDTPGLDAAMFAEIDAMRLRATDIRNALRGDPTLGKRVVPEPPSIGERVTNAIYSLSGSTEPPTKTQREQYDIAGREFEATLALLKTLVQTELPALESRLEKAGMPWTPGRVPEWKRK